MRIMITGGSGMVGRNLIHYLNKYSSHNLLYPTRSELNLLDNIEVRDYIKTKNPNVIIHCAGLVGGIQANVESPYLFLSRNLMMGFNIVEGAISNKIQKLINLGSSCMYPKDFERELKEEDILTGALEPTNEGYAVAKITVAKLCEYAKKQFNLDYKTIIPCNLYGMWDKFDPQNSHMIPAVIRKIHLAKYSGKIPEIWGDGSSRREFMYAEDLADFIYHCLNKYKSLDSYTNVGLGVDYSILDYYKEISSIVGYSGVFNHDLTKPSGMKKKQCSITKQNKMGWKPKHSLRSGLTKTYKFYLENYGV
tara:strand:- start:252 stop:1172 length:921 start_codon:yes stop_codon:yes gene_type:complete